MDDYYFSSFSKILFIQHRNVFSILFPYSSTEMNSYKYLLMCYRNYQFRNEAVHILSPFSYNMFATPEFSRRSRNNSARGKIIQILQLSVYNSTILSRFTPMISQYGKSTNKLVSQTCLMEILC